ncbi:MAG: hypothetical protein H6994_08110 [Pseudomonadales bacterium]|nr:hypothetical protein [Pseudomonadales bacterium]
MSDDLHELLFFLDDHLNVAVQMPMGEFEAVHTGAATLSTLAGRQVRAAYVGVDEALVVRGVVLFLLTVDQEGRLPEPFTLPLRHLLRHAGEGADLGYGRIRLASRAQCPVPWHARHLWHIEDNSVLETIQACVTRNEAGLVARRPRRFDPESMPGPRIGAPVTDRGWEGVSTSAMQRELAALRDKLQAAQEEAQRLRAALRHEQDRNRRLQDRLLGAP